jgi:hypothetical protein
VLTRSSGFTSLTWARKHGRDAAEDLDLIRLGGPGGKCQWPLRIAQVRP